MSHRDIVVIGASAGGIEALQQIARALPAALPATIFVTVHFPEQASSALPRILARAGSLAATHAVDGETIERARIYVAPPDSHLLLGADEIRLVRGPERARKSTGDRSNVSKRGTRVWSPSDWGGADRDSR